VEDAADIVGFRSCTMYMLEFGLDSAKEVGNDTEDAVGSDRAEENMY